GQHGAGDPAEQGGAEGDDEGEAIDELEHQRAAPDDDGHADQQAEADVEQLVVDVRVLRGAGDGDDVVQAHGEVRHDDGADGFPERAAGTDGVGFVVGYEQLDADPEQQQAADGLEEGDVQQGQRKGDERDAQGDGAGGAPQYALHALLV